MKKVMPVFLRTPYNYDMDAVSDETGLLCVDPSLAQQHMRDECDINVLVERFGLTGELPQGVRLPQYGDFTAVSDFHSAVNAVRQASEAFMRYPADVRVRFDHDPAKFMDFFNREENRAEAEKMGLVLASSPSVASPASVGTPPQALPESAAKAP